MGGFGSAQGMITSLKNNSRRNKREAFDHMSGKSDQESEGIEVVPVSGEALEKIRLKIKKQKRHELVKLFVIFLIAILLALFIIHLVINNDYTHFFDLYSGF